MKDIMQKLAELEATAPKVTKKKMLNEDSTTPPMNVSNKPASLKDVFAALSENVAPGQKPLPVLDPQKKQAGMGFVTSSNPSVQNILKNLDPKDVQIVQAPGQAPAVGQQPQATAAGQPNPNQLQTGQQAVQEKDEGKPGKNFAKIAKSAGERYGSKAAGERVAGAVRAKLAKQGKLEEESMEESGLQAYLGNKKYGKDGMDALRKAGREGASKEKMANIRAKHDKMDEGDIAPTSGIDTKGAGLGAGRSQTTLEGAKPDFLDLDKDGNKKEPMKKAAADKNKKKVKESMNHRISAARLEGKSHGLRGHAHSGKRYEDIGEMKAYHEGYKEGLDECYGQGVYETAPAMPAATVPGMANAAMPTMEDDMEEGNAFTAALAKTPKGGKFAVGGKTFTDRTGYDAKVNEYAFESLDQQLNALLNESEEVSEGLSVSISKGQQNSPDSVTITAQDQEAEHLLAFVKNAGLGLFGDDNADTHSSAMSVQPSHGAPDEVGAGGIDIGVVDGHDGMMGLMQKLSGIQAGGAEDYADEEGDEEQLYGNHEAADKKDCGCDGDCECSDYDQPSNEATCNECGSMMEAGHSCNEEQSEDQMGFLATEANAPDSGEAESTADEDAEAEEDAALAKSDMQNKTNTVNEGGDGGEASEEGAESKEGGTDEEGETVSESFANLFKKLAFIAEESTEKEDDKAEKAGKKVAKDIEHDEGHKGKDDDKAEKAGKKVTKDIEYDDKKDKKEKVEESFAEMLQRLQRLEEGSGDEPKHPEHDKKDDKDQDDAEDDDAEDLKEWANNAGPGKTVSDTTFEQDIDFMTKVIAGGLNKPKSTGQTTIPVIAGQDDRMHDNPMDWATLAGIKK
jgi:hypothetical protein